MNLRSVSHQGSALVSTLLAILVLTIIVTAFLQSMSVERQTARSYLNRFQAQLAAESGLAQAMNRLTRDGAATDFHYILSVADPGSETETPQLLVQAPNSSDVIETIALKSTSGSGATTRINTGALDAAGSIYRQAEFVSLEETSSGGDEIARFAFWIDPDNFKQNAELGNRTDRTSEPLPTGLPLIKPGGESLDAAAKNAVKALSESLPTSASINQAVAASPQFDQFHVTTYAPVEDLTPEGWQKLNLTRLKRYIDGGDFQADSDGDGVPETIASYAGLDARQGPDSPRFELIKQLLNEDGNFPFNSKNNPWGPGNLEFILQRYPDRDANGDPTEARQTVANLIDYIDADVVPTSDGQPGDPILNANADTSTATNQRATNEARWEIPAAQIFPAPTVLGVEAKRQDDGTILGHPFITAATVGLIFNPTGGGPNLNSSRILGDVTVVNPWDAPIRWKTSGTTGYVLEMQVKKSGTAVNGKNGSQLQVPGSSDGYFMNAWLAQYSGMVPSEFLTRSIGANGRVLFPRDWAGNFDLANGPYAINQPTANFRFVNFGSRIELLRLIKRDNTPFAPVPRYLVQDLRVLNELPREWNPATWSATGGIYKVGSGAYQQTDWHLLTDPRLNFQRESWRIAPSAANLAPAPEISVYTERANPDKDIQQGLSNDSSWWNEQGVNHFPNADNKDFQPSPGLTEPAMESFVELGFIATGRPWQTLRLYAEEPAAETDIGLLNYVALGDRPAFVTNPLENPEIDGLISVATGKRESLVALFSEVTEVEPVEAGSLADAILALTDRPFERIEEIFAQGTVFNEATTDYRKELLAAQIVPLATLRGRVFTVYSVGEVRRDGRTLSRVGIRATVELEAVETAAGVEIKPRILNKSIL